MISARSLSASTSTSNSFAQEIDARRRDRLADEHPLTSCHSRVLVRLERRRHRGPALDVGAELGEHELDRSRASS